MAAIVKKAVNSCEDEISEAMKTAPIVDKRDAIRRAALNPELKGLHELKALIGQNDYRFALFMSAAELLLLIICVYISIT